MCDNMLDDILTDTDERMDKTISAFSAELTKIRTGRASSGLVDNIIVDYYGAETPINQLATVSIPESKTIMIQPWDVSAIPEVEKAIMKSEIGINPSNDGKVIRLNIPALTEERRKELVKYVSKVAEEFRVSIRQIRHDVNHFVKDLEKEEGLPEDRVKKNLENVQKITDNHIKKISEILEGKEKEILEV
ncbi:MAG: ribosome-recycling factor [Thermodesulfobacteriota bacterium]|nr:MAG: ribosome-recycling factor [Thermodesulfobacteriota bacterium]